jgi:arylformamidase
LLSNAKKNFKERKIGKKVLEDIKNQLNKYEGILFKTGWGKKWGRLQYYNKFPFITIDLAKELIKYNFKFIGIDSPSIGSSEVHKILLNKQIIIIETLNLSDLKEKAPIIHAFPLALKGLDGSPIRVVAKINDSKI